MFFDGAALEEVIHIYVEREERKTFNPESTIVSVSVAGVIR
jgi:hypothetical protein